VDRARLLLAASGLPVHPVVAQFASPSSKSTAGPSPARSAAVAINRNAGSAPAATKFAWKKVDPPAISELLKSDAAETPEPVVPVADESTVGSSDIPKEVSTPTQGARSFKQITPNKTPREKSGNREQSTPKKTAAKPEQPSPSSKGGEAISPSGRNGDKTPTAAVAEASETKGESANSPLPKRTPRQPKKTPSTSAPSPSPA
jgi:hypothetical protein